MIKLYILAGISVLALSYYTYATYKIKDLTYKVEVGKVDAKRDILEVEKKYLQKQQRIIYEEINTSIGKHTLDI